MYVRQDILVQIIIAQILMNVKKTLMIVLSSLPVITLNLGGNVHVLRSRLEMDTIVQIFQIALQHLDLNVKLDPSVSVCPMEIILVHVI